MKKYKHVQTKQEYKLKIRELLSKVSQDIFQHVSWFHLLYSKELSLVPFDTPNNKLNIYFC